MANIEQGSSLKYFFNNFVNKVKSLRLFDICKAIILLMVYEIPQNEDGNGGLQTAV